jgi:hypothetical protein
MMDVTGDGQMDLVLMQEGAQAIRVLHNKGDGSFEEWDAAAAGLKASGHAVACAVGDYDGDGLNDLAVALDDAVLLFRNLGKGKFQDVTAEAGLAPKNRPTGITFVDYDHDGDLDLLLTGAPSKLAMRRMSCGATTATRPLPNGRADGIGRQRQDNAAILTDFNNDRAVDIAVTGDGPAPLIYVNPREGKVSDAGACMRARSCRQHEGIAVLDYNKDGWMDIAVTHAGAPGLTLWRNVEGPNHVGRRFERVELPLHGALRGWGVDADRY